LAKLQQVKPGAFFRDTV